MKLEEQVVSLEIAKKLKELGVEQESYFWWVDTKEEGGEGFRLRENRTAEWLEHLKATQPAAKNMEYYSAFTVAELGEMLPDRIESFEFQLCKYKNTIEHKFIYLMGYWDVENHEWRYVQEGYTEADARGKMLIYLKENKLI